MEEKTIKMTIYYILAVYEDDKKNLESCIELIKLFIAMTKNEETKLDRLIDGFPAGHPVTKLYNEIKETESEKLLEILENSKEKFLNYQDQNIDLSKIEDDSEVEELSKKILGV